MGLVKWAVILLGAALAYTYIPKLFQPRLKPVVEGHFHPKFRRVAEKLRANVESGKERGCAFAVYHNGEPLVDMWAGYADPQARRPWSEDTMTVVFSTGKGMAAMTVARMVDKGWLDYDKPVAHYWPEFAQNGKGDITVAQLMRHEAGLISFENKFNILEVKESHENHKKYIDTLEKATPLWKPGTKVGYHAVTLGFYVDVLVQKADPKHRNMTQFFREEIGVPFGIDFHMGVAKQDFHRLARGHFMSLMENTLASLTKWRFLKVLSAMILYPDSPTGKALGVVTMDNNQLNDPEYSAVGVSAFMGFGTARSIAKLYSFIANGGTVKGKQFLSQTTLSRFLKPVPKQIDVVVMMERSIGLGVAHTENPYGQFKGSARVCHPGAGGNMGFAEPSTGLSVGYVTNFPSEYGFGDDPRYLDLEETFYECFEDYIKERKS